MNAQFVNLPLHRNTHCLHKKYRNWGVLLFGIDFVARKTTTMEKSFCVSPNCRSFFFINVHIPVTDAISWQNYLLFSRNIENVFIEESKRPISHSHSEGICTRNTTKINMSNENVINIPVLFKIEHIEKLVDPWLFCFALRKVKW